MVLSFGINYLEENIATQYLVLLGMNMIGVGGVITFVSSVGLTFNFSINDVNKM